MYKSMHRPRWRHALVPAIALFLVAGAGITSAAADPAAVQAGDCVTTPDGGAKACFHAGSSDSYSRLEVCDNRPDGHHPGAFYTIQSSPNRQRLIENFNGFGTCEGVLLDLPDGSWIKFRAMNIEGNDILSASGWVTSYA